MFAAKIETATLAELMLPHTIRMQLQALWPTFSGLSSLVGVGKAMFVALMYRCPYYVVSMLTCSVFS